jgi:hypothetical protein
MSNFGMGWRNHVFTTPSATLETFGPGTVTAGALTALQDMRLSKRVTLTDTTAGEGAATVGLHWFVDSGSAVAIRLIGLLNYTVSAPGATAINWSITIAKASGGALSDEPLTVYERPSDDFPSHLWKLLDTEIDDAYDVILTVSASFGSGGGTLSFTPGALWLSPWWTLPRGLEASWWQKQNDLGRMGLSEGNQGYPRRRKRRRVFGGRAVHIPFEYAYGDETDPTVLDVQQLLYRVGTTEPIALFPRTLNRAGALSAHVMHRLGVYGHFSDTGRIEEMGGDEYQWTGVELAELM